METDSAHFDARRGASAQAYRVLRDRIVSGALRPGDLLSEPKVATMFGVSRTPVREVFKRLRDEGLLEILPHVGTLVSRIDIEQVREDQFVRETLECRVLELATERIGSSATGRRELEASIDRQNDFVAQNDARGFIETDDEFHALLFRLSGHVGAWRTVQAGDGLAAITAMRGHLRTVFAAIESIALAEPDFFACGDET